MELGLTEFDEKIRCGRGILLCGTDEAGRGPLAGPVFAAAVILPERVEIKGLGDSKKLSPKKRETLFTEICEKALAFSVCSASVFEIEEINIQNASLLAMSRAVNSLKCRDGGVIAPDLVLVDGNLARGFEYPAEAVIGGDGKSAAIAAASILAKVSRDAYMAELDKLYPEYGFARHKGYGTKEHYAALERHGPCPEHRLSFLKKLFINKPGVAQKCNMMRCCLEDGASPRPLNI